MAANKWYVPTSLQTLLTTELDSLASGSAALSAAYNNTSALDLIADFILAVDYASITGISAGNRIGDLYIEPAVDATNYPTVGSSVPQRILLAGVFETRAPSTTVLEYLVIPGIPIPPLNFKVRFVNGSGQALRSNASSKFVKMQTYQLQTV